ncbi:ATPase, T2SS/T4P/T4SS family [Maritalea sp.]|uniref:ATPase, T2SS/T4P/T4SS family n=1 Tax=Maritalea sp. TaxID=2003361 RepID=UPI003EFA9935
MNDTAILERPISDISESIEAEYSVTERRTHEKLKRELGFLWDLLQEDNLQEILVNPDGSVFVDRAGSDRERVGSFPPTRVECFLSTVASTMNEVIDHRRPYIDGVLILDGSRISGEIPPTVSAPSMRIRKHAKFVQPLDVFVSTGVMTDKQFQILQQAILDRRNIVIVGGTAAGKTFLANSLLLEMAKLTPDDRVLTIEDTKELNVSSKDSLSWVTSPEVGMQLMLRRALRATPKRIVVGEVRGGEAYQLLKMWGTGHSGGLCTIHSDKGALDGLKRLERMCGESDEARGMGRDWIRETVADVVHVLVNITKADDVRTIPRIVKVSGFDASSDEYDYESIER